MGECTRQNTAIYPRLRRVTRNDEAFERLQARAARTFLPACFAVLAVRVVFEGATVRAVVLAAFGFTAVVFAVFAAALFGFEADGAGDFTRTRGGLRPTCSA